MSYSETDLVSAVLRHLRVADAVDAADSADVALVQQNYEALWEEISSHGNEWTYWNMSTIPRPVFLILRDLVALESQNAFGLLISPADKEQNKELLMRRLRRHLAIQSTGLQTKVDYY